MSKLNKTQIIEERKSERLSLSMQVETTSSKSQQNFQVHLCQESSILIPLINACSISWDDNLLFQQASQENNEDSFINFKQCLLNQSLQLQNAYKIAIKTLDFLEAKLKYQGNAYKIEASINSDDKRRSSTNIQSSAKQIRREVYLYRKELKEIISICAEAEIPLLLAEAGNIRQELMEKYQQLIEDFLPGLFFDDLTIEIVQNYIANQSHSDSDEVQHYNQIKQFMLQSYLPSFRILTFQLYEMAKLELTQTDNLLIKVQNLGRTSNVQTQSLILYFDLPQLIDEYKVNLNQQCSLLPQTIQEDNEFLILYKKNSELESKINNDLRDAHVQNQDEQLERNCLQTEFNQLIEQQKYFYELYLFQKEIPVLIESLRSINIERTQMWKSLPQNLYLNKERIQEMQQICGSVETRINEHFTHGKIPFKFLQVSLQAQFEKQSLEVLLNYDLSEKQTQFVNNPSLNDRIQELLKWEYNGDNAQGDNAEINEYLMNNIFNKQETQQYIPPQIEIEMDIQLEQSNPENINDIMELNENYNIWKNMQAAGIFLNEDNLSVKLQDPSKLPEFGKILNQLKKFFSINEQPQYVGYITDILTTIDFVLKQDNNGAIQFIKSSKQIPRIYKQTLIESLNKY